MIKHFCTVDDLILAFDEDEVRRLSDRAKPPTGKINNDVVDKAIARASAEIGMYLSGRNLLVVDKIPEGLVGIACDITRYYLHPNPVPTSPAGETYKIRIKQLEDIAKGKIGFGADKQGEIVEPESTIEFTCGVNVFKRRGGIF